MQADVANLYKIKYAFVGSEELIEILILALQLLTMRIDELQTVVDDDTLGCQLTERKKSLI